MPLRNPFPPVQEPWQSLTLQNGWVNFGGAYAPARYCKDSFGLVIIEGIIRNGTAGAIVATLPTAYRPQYQLAFQTAANDGVQGRFIVGTNGAITHLNGATTGTFLIGIHYRLL